jgi:hypothetical protein
MSTTVIQYEKMELSNIEELKQLPQPELVGGTSKMKFNKTVKHLLLLFKFLIDEEVIKTPSEWKEMFQMIALSFSTDKAKDISPDQLQKVWSELKDEPKIAEYWKNKFIDLHNAAKEAMK